MAQVQPPHARLRTLAIAGLVTGLPALLAAEDLEPRRWNHLPTGLDVVGVGYAYTQADIGFDPVLQLTDVELELQTWVAKYVHTFALFDHSARVELAQGYQHGRWTGLLSGQPATTSREGAMDTIARFAMNLYGAPPLTRQEFAAYRAQAAAQAETIVGAALLVQAPTGQYHSDRLINLGTNRFTLAPQLGVQHNWGELSLEYTGSVWFYTDNNDFFGGRTLEKDPLLALQGHVIYHLPARCWTGLSAAYTYGGRNTIDGADADDLDENLILSLSVGFPLYGPLSGKLAWLGSRTRTDTGMDSDSLVAAISLTW